MKTAKMQFVDRICTKDVPDEVLIVSVTTLDNKKVPFRTVKKKLEIKEGEDGSYQVSYEKAKLVHAATYYPLK